MWEALLKIMGNLVAGMVIIAIIDSIRIREFGDNFLVALVIALINAALVPLLNMLGFPLPYLLVGLSILLIDGLIVRYIHLAVAGFSAQGIRCSLLFGGLMAVVNILLMLAL
ncbi:phage holin family protein [Roseivirga sp. BDSF3-8]|uniref:phage holin family protein n=1 Tax=Roseivirga sp. BDSF3-8 TaxID=3241598 RepID=UPI003531C8DB